MNVGIYIDGLGQSVASESAVQYSTRLMNEISFNTTGVNHELKIEKIKYTNERESNVISIIEKDSNGNNNVVYKLYEFRYGEIMTTDFKKKNIFLKNIMLFGLVLKKFPILIKRIFITDAYNRPFQTFYIFFLFFIIAAAILFMIPATITIITNFMLDKEVIDFVHHHPWLHSMATLLGINSKSLNHFSELFVSVTSIILILVPAANTIVTTLATEFVCAHYYLQYGQQKQDILGNIDKLFEYIAENDKDSKIHIHAYSYGSIVALDYLFPYSGKPSMNMLDKTTALVTIGTPFDFIKSYYPEYYTDRSVAMESKISWLNVYSVADALGSNFRQNYEAGDAEYGISKEGLKPQNINYEVVKINKNSFFNFITLNSLKMHGMYWGSTTDGQSCLKDIYPAMKNLQLL